MELLLNCMSSNFQHECNSVLLFLFLPLVGFLCSPLLSLSFFPFCPHCHFPSYHMFPCLHLQGGEKGVRHQLAAAWQKGRRQHRGGICWLHIPLVSYTPLTTAKSDQSQRSVLCRPMRSLRHPPAAHSGNCRPILDSTHGCTVQHMALVNITCRLSNYTADGF